MSLTAIIVLTLVVLVGMAGWLGAIFFVAREPRAGSVQPGGEGPGRASQLEGGTHPGDVPVPAQASALGGGGALTRAGRDG